MARELRIRVQIEDTDQARRALGDVEQGLKNVEQAGGKVSSTVGSESKGDSVVGSLKNMKGIIATLGIGVAIQQSIDWAGRLTDLAAKTGISAKALQELDAAGGQVGVSIDQVANGILRLQKNLTSDQGAIRAVQSLGLSAQELIRMAPDQMFRAIAVEVAKIEDPTLRNAKAIEILQRTAGDLLPLMVSDIDKLAQKHTYLSDTATAALDDLGDAWARFKRNRLNEVGEIVAAFTNLGAAQELLAKQVVGEDMLRGWERYNDLLSGKGIPSGAVATTKAFQDLAPATKSVADAQAELYKAIGTPDEQMKRVEAQLKAADAAKRHADELQKLAEVYTGKALNDELRKMNEALLLADRAGGMTVQQMGKLVKELQDLERQGGRLLPRQHALVRQYRDLDLGTRTLTDATKILTASLDAQTRVVLDALPPWGYFQHEVLKTTGGIEDLLPKLDQLGKRYHSNVIETMVPPKSDGWRDWFNVADSTISDIVMAAKRGSEGILLYASGFARDFTATALDILVPGLGSIVTMAWPLIEEGLKKIWEGLKAFWNKVKGIFNFFGSAPRDSQQDVIIDQATGQILYDPNQPNNPTPGFDPGNPDYQPGLPDGDAFAMLDGLQPMARGGIVTRPTRALIGEAGPEAVIPLSKPNGLGNMTIILQVDRRTLAEAIVPVLPDVVRSYRLA